MININLFTVMIN